LSNVVAVLWLLLSLDRGGESRIYRSYMVIEVCKGRSKVSRRYASD
jgi:hypothetical protein